jgi:hypothetical protein
MNRDNHEKKEIALLLHMEDMEDSSPIIPIVTHENPDMSDTGARTYGNPDMSDTGVRTYENPDMSDTGVRTYGNLDMSDTGVTDTHENIHTMLDLEDMTISQSHTHQNIVTSPNDKYNNDIGYNEMGCGNENCRQPHPPTQQYFSPHNQQQIYSQSHTNHQNIVKSPDIVQDDIFEGLSMAKTPKSDASTLGENKRSLICALFARIVISIYVYIYICIYIYIFMYIYMHIYV